MRTDSRELQEWMIFDSLEPFGPQAANLNTGIITAMLANVNRGKDSKAYSPIDFAIGEFEDRSKEKKAQTPEEIKNALLGLVELGKSKKEKQ